MIKKSKKCKHNWWNSVDDETTKECTKCWIRVPREEVEKPKECKHINLQVALKEAGSGLSCLDCRKKFTKEEARKMIRFKDPVESRDEGIEEMIDSLPYTFNPITYLQKQISELEQRLDELEKFNNTRFAVNYVDITQLETRLEKLEKSNKKKHEQTN